MKFADFLSLALVLFHGLSVLGRSVHKTEIQITETSITVALPDQDLTCNCLPEYDTDTGCTGSTANQECTFVFDENQKTVAGSVVDLETNNIHQISTAGDGYYATTTHVDEFPPELDPDDENGPLDELAPVDENIPSSGFNDDGSVLDVLVVWTRKAECLNARLAEGCTVTATTTASMKTLLDLAIRETNDAYKDSGVLTELNLVHSYRDETYVETGFSSSLSDLRGTSDGKMDDVHDKRETYKADIVAMIIADSQYCGIANVGPNKSLMFSVTAYNCATGYYSFGHEIGHNQGCLHDRGTQNKCDQNGYQYGWRNPEGRFRTVLSYSCRAGQCDNNSGNSCTRRKRFSSATLKLDGYPTGDAYSDNARKINDVKFQVANYYQSSERNPMSSPTNPPVPDPTPAPVKPPTERPVPRPTQPPVPGPAGCVDDPNFTMFSGSHTTCAWIGKQQRKVNRFCKRKKPNGVIVCSKCCQTCARCTLRKCKRRCGTL